MSKDYTRLVCICGKSFSRKVVDGQVYACSRPCRRKLLAEIGYQCARCKERLPESEFGWYNDSRYFNGKRRLAYCLNCDQIRIDEYRSNHKEDMKKQHDKWREKNISAGGDVALRWYLKRRLGAYHKECRDIGVECNIDADYLIEIFHNQDGKCYYTQEVMGLNNYGRGRGNQFGSTLSVDRLTPNLGYVKGNIVLCTHLSNTSKGARNEDEFYSFCEIVLASRANRMAENKS